MIPEIGHFALLIALCIAFVQAILPLAGASLVPAFAGEPLDREAIYWEHEGNRAVRRGDWKLVARNGGPWELYNLAEDRSELHDRSGEMAEKVAQMTAAQ